MAEKGPTSFMDGPLFKSKLHTLREKLTKNRNGFESSQIFSRYSVFVFKFVGFLFSPFCRKSDEFQNLWILADQSTLSQPGRQIMPPKSLLATHLDFRFFRHPCVLYHCTGRFIHDSSLSTTQMVLQCIYPCFHQIDPSVLKLPIQQLNGACICSNELISNLTSFHTLGILFTIYHQKKIIYYHLSF